MPFHKQIRALNHAGKCGLRPPGKPGGGQRAAARELAPLRNRFNQTFSLQALRMSLPVTVSCNLLGKLTNSRNQILRKTVPFYHKSPGRDNPEFVQTDEDLA